MWSWILPYARFVRNGKQRGPDLCARHRSGGAVLLEQEVWPALDFAEEYARLEQSGQFVMASFAPSDGLSFDQDSAVPEMHDRIIVGLARRLDAACISRDPLILESGLVPGVW